MKPVELEILLKDGASAGIDRIGAALSGLPGKGDTAKELLSELTGAAEQARKTIAGLGENFDLRGGEKQISALRVEIERTQQGIEHASRSIEGELSQAEEAFASGNIKAYEALSVSISEHVQEVTRLTGRYEELQSALNMMSGSGAEAPQPEVDVPRFYTSQEDYEYAGQLREKIAELRAELIAADDAQMPGLQEALTRTKDRLNEVEGKAAEAASSLGLELGGKAAETSTRLYELEAAIKRQKVVISSLETAVNGAKDSLEAMQASGADISALEAAHARYDSLAQSLSNAKDQMRLLQGTQSDTKAEMASVNSEIDAHNSIIVKMLGGYDKFNGVISNLPGPIQGVITSLTGMTGAAKAFIATPLGAVIAAIVLALQALKSWFDSSAEGQMAFAKISGYAGGVLNQLKEIVIGAGKAIYDAFSNPKQAVKDLWEAIKSNIVNRVKAVGGIFSELGSIIKETFNGNLSEAGNHFDKLKDQVSQAVTGVENLRGKVKDYVSGVHEAAKANSDLAVREEQLARNRSKWGIEEQRLQNKLNELRNKMYSGSKGDRVNARSEAQQIVDQIVSQKKIYAQEELDIVKARNALTTNAQQDYDAEYEAERKLLAVEGERTQMMMRFERGAASASSSLESQARQKERAATSIAQMEEALTLENSSRRIALMKEGQDKETALMLQQKEEQLKKINDLETKFRQANQKAGNGDGLTSGQSKMIAEARELAQKEYAKAEEQQQKAEMASMLQYLQEYGNFQQQKLAIAQEYAKKIKEANAKGDQWEARRLEKERDAKIGRIDTQAIEKKIDWQTAFGSLTGVLRDEIKKTLDSLKDYTKTDRFAASSAEDKATIYSAMERLQTELPGGDGTLDIRGLMGQFDALGAKLGELQGLYNENEEAQQRLTEAQQWYRRTLDTGTGAQQAAAKAVMIAAEGNAARTKAAYEQAASDVESFGRNVKAGADDTVKGISGVARGLGKLNSGSLATAYDGLVQSMEGLKKLNLPGKVGDAVSSLSDALGSSSFIGGLIGAVLSLLDVLKDGIGTLISGLIDTIFDAVIGIIDNIITGKFAVQVFDSLKNGIGGLLDTVTFGGFSSWFGTSGNTREVNELTERLTESNENLRRSIDKLKDEIVDSNGGWRAIRSAREARDAQESVNRNALEILMAQMGYHGAHHSNTYYWNLSGEDYRSINETLAQYAAVYGKDAKRVGSLTDLYELTPEEMDYIRSHNIEMWEQIISQGKYDKGEYWEAYADEAGKLEEITQQLKETLTQMSFGSLRESFVNDLMDMSKDAQDFCDDLSGWLMKSVLNAKISDLLDDELEKFYDRWAEYAESGNELTASEQEELRRMYEELSRRGIALRDEVAAVTGYEGSGAGSGQSGRSGAYTALSQEQGTKLEGLGASIAMHTASIDEKVENVSEMMRAASETLQKIEENTAANAASAKEIKDLIVKIARDGIKTR